MRKTYIWAWAAVLWLLSAAAVPAQTLRTGMSGEAVTALQEALAGAGYFARAADGDYGSTTTRAVALFQKDHGLAVTGAADDKTAARIRKAEGKEGRKGGGVILTEGNRGRDVADYQSLLSSAGFLNGPVDGVYGPATTLAVRTFQKNRKLPVSGVLDEATAAALSRQDGEAPDEVREDSKRDRNTLQRGDRGEAVALLQRQLIRSGYLSGEADGVFGADTESAVRSFQAKQNWTASGRTDQKFQKALAEAASSSLVLREGSRGSQVARLQNLLTLHGFTTGASDGIYGSGTAAKVREFQDFYGLEETGAADGAVWDKLESAPVFLGSYKKMMHMQSTAYTPYDGGGTGRTASGNIAGKGHAAVDPAVIPLGSLIYIESYGYAIADDIGGSINGQIVDVCVDTLDQAYRWGTRSVNVYLVK